MSDSKSNTKQCKLFSDATLKKGAWIDGRGNIKNFLIPKNFQHSSYEAEFFAAFIAISDNSIPDTHIHLYCDHQGVCSMLKKRAARHPKKHPGVNQLLVSLLSLLKISRVTLSVSWISSKSNPADKLSRSALMPLIPLPVLYECFVSALLQCEEIE